MCQTSRHLPPRLNFRKRLRAALCSLFCRSPLFGSHGATFVLFALTYLLCMCREGSILQDATQSRHFVQVNCCGPSKAPTLQNVQNYYGKVLSTTKDLKTSACTAAGRPHQLIVEALKDVPDEIKQKFYGCGAPLPLGIDGLRVLDLGSGSGRDCYVASRLVGEHLRSRPVLE